MTIDKKSPEVLRQNIKNKITCPKCKSEDITRIHRNAFFKTVFFFVPFKRFGCESCTNKFHIVKR